MPIPIPDMLDPEEAVALLALVMVGPMFIVEDPDVILIESMVRSTVVPSEC